MPWVVFALIALLLAISLSGHDLFSLGYFRSVFALLIVYLCWSAVINTSLSAYLRLAIRLVQSPAFHSTLRSFNTFARNYGMFLATGVAIGWLLSRAFQVLHKPVPELIAILGVDVPDKPDLSVAGIRSDAATLTWAPPPPNRPVQHFVIEVNGVNVGDTPSQETAITVTGLKPSHFYNLRVIAVSSNNFRVGSRITRIETHSAEGRPNIDTRLVSDSYFATRKRPRQNTDIAREAVETKVPSVEAANLADAGLGPSGTQGAMGRRNTIGRKHSPSTASVEPPAPIKESHDEEETDASVAELTTKLDQVRREIEEIAQAISEEEGEHQKALAEFRSQKDEQQALLKDRSDTSRKLKSDMAKSESAAQDAHKAVINNKKAAEKEHSDKDKMQERIKAMKENMEAMANGRLRFEEERETLKLDYEQRAKDVKEVVEATKSETTRLERELKEKREKLKSLQAENKNLPSTKDDQAWKEKRLQAKHDNERKSTALANQLQILHRKTKELERTLMAMQSNPQHAIAALNSQTKDRDFGQHGQIKRRARATTSLPIVTVPVTSPTTVASPEPAFPATSSFASTRTTAPPPGLAQFAEAPSYMTPMGQQMDVHFDDGSHAPGEPPLSPGAATYLPRGIFDDDPGPGMDDVFGPRQSVEVGYMAQSPASSSRSLGRLSSPRGSSNHLPFSGDVNERTSNLNLRSSPNAPPARTSTTHGLSNIFSLSRSRGGKSVDEGGGPPLGSLKSGQSQSFPRQADEDALAGRKKSAFGNWGLFNRNSVGPDFLGSEGSSPSRVLRTSFNNSSTGFAPPDADPISPRPASMASSDIPRPSTDSGRWGGVSFADFSASHSSTRVWGHSRTQSRRTSVHAAPTTNLASEDDIILDKADLAKPETSPSQVGVIGSRPKRKSLNPGATSFIGGRLFRNKGEKDDTANESDAKAKVRTKKDKAREKKEKKKKDKEAPASTPDTTEFQYGIDSSPTESRKFSMDGRTSVSMSESRESFSLDAPHSNTPSEANAASPVAALKDQENVVKKLFRKGSTSKFNLSGKFSKDSGVGFFKKGPSSVATNASERAERSSISISEADDYCDEAAASSNLGKGPEGSSSSPSLAPSGSVKGRWNMFRKKGKEKESLEMEREDTPAPES